MMMTKTTCPKVDEIQISYDGMKWNKMVNHFVHDQKVKIVVLQKAWLQLKGTTLNDFLMHFSYKFH